jgi:hypothetical protein
MFPVAGDEIYRNEAGEVTGWSKPASAEDYYCDPCGFSHAGPCPPDERDDDDDDDDDMLDDMYWDEKLHKYVYYPNEPIPDDEVSEEEAAYYQKEAERGDLAGSPHTLGCYECRGFDGVNFETQEVIALGPIVGTDPTQTYVLKCGHTTI